MTVQLSQVILVLAMLAFALYALQLRTLLADRIIYLVLACGGLVLVIQPDLSTLVDNQLGIGRGTDLILYLFVVFSLFHFVNLASQLNKQERQITALVRRCAIADAKQGMSGEIALPGRCVSGGGDEDEQRAFASHET
jgi:hypothetical protein